jgi:hypothetical protein
VAQRVDHEVADLVDPAGAAAHAATPTRAGPAQQRAHPGHQLAGAVGLGEVVVGAEVEAEQQIVLGRAGGQHDDRDRRVDPQHPAHVEPVDLGQHEVEDDQVGDLAAGVLQGAAAVVDHRHGVALALEVHADQLRLLHVVLDDQDPRAHRPPVWTTGHEEPAKTVFTGGSGRGTAI